MYKKCNKCGEEKPINCFRECKTSKDGYLNQCKICEKNSRNKYTNICEICGKEFKTQTKNAKYCSKECLGYSRRNRVSCKCDYCNKDIEVTKKQYESHEKHFCNLKCANNYQKENPIKGEESSRFNQIEVLCGNCKKKILVSKYKYERAEFNYCSNECQQEHYKIRYKGKNNPMYGTVRPEVTGSNNWNWNPSLTDEERENNRNTKENDNFKREVRERDDYTCQCCGKRGGDNVVHHIYGYSEYKNLRYDVDNGLVLCVDCHKNYHKSYGYKNNNWRDFRTFLFNEWEKTDRLNLAHIIEEIDLRLSIKDS